LDILVLGCGRIGSTIIRDLANNPNISEIHAVDADAQTLARLNTTGLKAKISKHHIELRDKAKLLEVCSEADLMCGALPGALGEEAIRLALEAGLSLIDVAFTPVDPYNYDMNAQDAGITIIPQCGVAPGLTNILVGHGKTLLDEMEEVRIFVGGLPQNPKPPLNYIITWSPSDLLEMYTRPAQMVKNGGIGEAEPLSDLKEEEFEGAGKLEHFRTGGLGTLARSYPHVKLMEERTIRYPGHAFAMSLLGQLGFYNREPISVDGVRVSPRSVTSQLLTRFLTDPNVRDMVVFRVEVSGKRKFAAHRIRYDLLDKYDEATNTTAMARTTAYTCTAVTSLLADGKITKRGIVTPESLGENPQHFAAIKDYLGQRKVSLTETAK